MFQEILGNKLLEIFKVIENNQIILPFIDNKEL